MHSQLAPVPTKSMALVAPTSKGFFLEPFKTIFWGNLRSLSNSYFLFLAKNWQLKLCGGEGGLRCYGYNRLVDWWIFSVKKLQINIKRRKIVKMRSPTISIVLVFHFKLKMAIIYNDVTEVWYPSIFTIILNSTSHFIITRQKSMGSNFVISYCIRRMNNSVVVLPGFEHQKL